LQQKESCTVPYSILQNYEQIFDQLSVTTLTTRSAWLLNGTTNVSATYSKHCNDRETNVGQYCNTIKAPSGECE